MALGDRKGVPDRKNTVSTGVEAKKEKKCWKCTFEVGAVNTKPGRT